mmetsp:Transcript_24097/g.68566  ORF Transcript_24097/g.68566 Transcript_24097/m.68566 type:complete len:235 (-) Transcript_24097:2374-3078(-)
MPAAALPMLAKLSSIIQRINLRKSAKSTLSPQPSSEALLSNNARCGASTFKPKHLNNRTIEDFVMVLHSSSATSAVFCNGCWSSNSFSRSHQPVKTSRNSAHSVGENLDCCAARKTLSIVSRSSLRFKPLINCTKTHKLILPSSSATPNSTAFSMASFTCWIKSCCCSTVCNGKPKLTNNFVTSSMDKLSELLRAYSWNKFRMRPISTSVNPARLRNSFTRSSLKRSANAKNWS